MNHNVTTVWVKNNHGYPYRADCTCGWSSNTYAAEHAAQSMGEDHIKSVTNVHTNTRSEDIALSKQLFG